ncbi:hypothetical protein ACFQY8_07730 [Alloscardovia venturai]|uniref:DUF4913 domain-containing protein n=1 Tax=Alloscardovia venturai TaxID=1769421 RepID=A0ABW2Y5U8_9BIFI
MSDITPVTAVNVQRATPSKDQSEDERSALVYNPYNWYESHNIEQAEQRMWVVARFADWLCGVNPELDNALPACWLRHAWPVMIMDALYTRYIGSYAKTEDHNTGPVLWIDHVETTINQIRQWSAASNHQSANSCPGADDEISPLRIRRHEEEEKDGYLTDRNYTWPENTATSQTRIDEIMTTPRLNEA